MIVPTCPNYDSKGPSRRFPHVGFPEGRMAIMAVALLEVALSSIKAFSTARPPLKLRPNHAAFYGQIMRILLGISWDIIDIMGINGIYFNGTIWYHINSFFSQPLLVTAQNEQNKHVSCSGQSQFVITARHRCPTVILLLGSKTHPWKVSIRGRSLRNNTMLQRDFKRNWKVVHPQSIRGHKFLPSCGRESAMQHWPQVRRTSNTRTLLKFSVLVRCLGCCLDSGSSEKLQHPQCFRT